MGVAELILLILCVLKGVLEKQKLLLVLLLMLKLIGGDLDNSFRGLRSLRRRLLAIFVPPTEVAHEGLKVAIELVVQLAKVYGDRLLARTLATVDEVLRKVTVALDETHHADEVLLADAHEGLRMTSATRRSFSGSL